ncbi:hypothetical protein ACFLS1_00075 [Verrucomicrobiota bacterium]
MKIKNKLLLLSASIFLFSNIAPAKAGTHTLAIGGRTHAEHSEFVTLPFDKGDISYGLAYEYHNESAYWQFGANYANDVTGTNTVDSVITPHADLIFKDRMWQGGIGVLQSYIDDENEGSDWTDLYWQLITGLQMPLFGLQMDFQVYYVFEDWGDIDKFDLDDLEYGIWVKRSF